MSIQAPEGASQCGLAVDAALLEHRPQLAHEDRERLLPRRWQRLTPEQLGKLVSRDRPAVLREQVCEHEPPLTAWKRALVEARAVRLDRDAPCE